MHHNALRLLATVLVVLGLVTLGVAPAAAQEVDLTVEVTYDQATVDPRTGQVTLSGTITCSERAFVTLLVVLRQEAGPTPTAQAFFGVSVVCPGPEGITWSRTVTGGEGRFHPGPVRLIARVIGCVFESRLGCVKFFFEDLDTTIRLAPAT
jgi:hypothetical protein